MITLDEIKEKYRYTSDSSLYGVNELWTGLKEIDGKLYGDCEDFCVELKKLEEFKDWDYYYCKLDGVGHCVLIKDGMIIDCNVKDVVSLDTYCKVYNVSGFKKYSLFTIGSKIMFSWGYLLWRKLLR